MHNPYNPKLTFSDDVMVKVNHPRCLQHNADSCRACPDSQKCFKKVMQLKIQTTYVDQQIVNFLRIFPDLYGPREYGEPLSRG